MTVYKNPFHESLKGKKSSHGSKNYDEIVEITTKKRKYPRKVNKTNKKAPTVQPYHDNQRGFISHIFYGYDRKV